MLTDAVSRILHLAGTLEASARIHGKLMDSILGTTLRCVVLYSRIHIVRRLYSRRWLDATPKSRVVARFTDDIGQSEYPFCVPGVLNANFFAVDGQISSFLLKLLELSASMLVRLVLVMVVAPIFTAVVLLFGTISGFCARAYMKAQLPVKREQSKTRAPLIGLLNLTVASLGTSEAAFELLTVG